MKEKGYNEREEKKMQVNPKPAIFVEKEIKELTEKEISNICIENKTDCHECPLAIINGCEVVCVKEILKRKAKVQIN